MKTKETENNDPAYMPDVAHNSRLETKEWTILAEMIDEEENNEGSASSLDNS